MTDHSNALFKFPRSRHLVNVGGASRDDLVLSKREAAAFVACDDLVVEEKVDGANLGISLDPGTGSLVFQNRSHYVSSETATQFKGLETWAAQNPGLYDVLGPNVVLFGEWLAYRHSIHYTRLPGLFVAYDVYDRQAQKFFSADRRDGLLRESGIPVVPRIARGRFAQEQLVGLLQSPSQYYDGRVEGVYLRRDSEEWSLDRAKIVRTDFLQSEVHWAKSTPVKNVVLYQ